MIKITADGDTNIGLYGFCTEKHLISGLPSKESKQVAKEAGVKRVSAMLFNTDLAGIFAAGNSAGIVVARLAEDFSRLPENLNILKIETKHTAIGNLILANDYGAVISPILRRHAKEIGDFLNVKTAVSEIAGLGISGSAAIATNKGCLVHPRVKDREKKIVEEVLGVRATIGTLNFGSPYVKAGVITNSRGFAVSPASSGPEMGNATEALGFL